MIRRCPQCGTAADDKYGFCYKCGYEFPKIEVDPDTCQSCGFHNPPEADYCVKCGAPLVFKQQFEKTSTTNLGPIVIQKEVVQRPPEQRQNRTSRWLILFGYIFSILGGVIGLIIAIYLSTRKDPVARKHGHIQLAIFIFYIALILILYATGNIPADAIAQYKQILSGNFTRI
ncbi:zinc ribbon domain-containing protein [Methanobrevibacter sp.]|uniref:zinc ribbon domain-containing protein n=1 Tax=Methanobrevibacter sp. TaxID=66852 RepID=UPI002E7935DE|nr:zinc ribbon domain-containing protein [Methanobrevibacter sp.]MEE1336091.1 zinc ribbon domain-containing protein [Methanobrevibacter sp.]